MKLQKPVFLLTLAALFATGCQSDEENLSETPKIRLAPAEVLEVQTVDEYPIEKRFVGTVEAKRTSHLAFELAGTIETISRDEGEPVKKGDLLAAIDTSRLEARKKELQAALTEAEANLTLARLNIERNEKLVKTGAVSRSQTDEATRNLAASQANVNRIQAQLDSVAVDLGKSKLLAPFDGIIAKRNADEGSIVSPNEDILEVIESGNLEIRAALAGESVDDLQVGDKLEIDIGGDTRELVVSRILPLRDSVTRSIDVILSVPGEWNDRLRDGDIIEVIDSSSVNEKGVFLPRDALTESTRGLWACFVAMKDPEAGPEAHRLDRRDIEVIQEYADSVFVRGPLQTGDWVLSSGLQKVAPGQRVKVVKVKQSDTATAPSL